MIIRFASVLLMGIFFFLPSRESAKIDTLRSAISNKSFTLKYEVIIPTNRQTNKELTLKKEPFKQIEAIDKIVDNVRHEGVIVLDGENKYIEYTMMRADNKLTGLCRLIKNNEEFKYHWEIKKDEKKYYKGHNFSHSKSIKAERGEPLNPYQAIFEDYNYGSPTFTNALTVVLPPERIMALPDTPEYKFIDSGTLENGLSYEDFLSKKNDTVDVLRYYFDGERPVKIAYMNYSKVNNVISDYTKAVINITEFSSTPAQKYLSLPEELKDKTKRKEGSK